MRAISWNKPSPQHASGIEKSHWPFRKESPGTHTAQQRDAQRKGMTSRGRPKVTECDRNCLLLPSSAWEFLDSFTGRSSSGQVQPEMRISKPHHNKGVDVHPSWHTPLQWCFKSFLSEIQRHISRAGQTLIPSASWDVQPPASLSVCHTTSHTQGQPD